MRRLGGSSKRVIPNNTTTEKYYTDNKFVCRSCAQRHDRITDLAHMQNIFHEDADVILNRMDNIKPGMDVHEIAGVDAQEIYCLSCNTRLGRYIHSIEEGSLAAMTYVAETYVVPMRKLLACLGANQSLGCLFYPHDRTRPFNFEDPLDDSGSIGGWYIDNYEEVSDPEHDDEADSAAAARPGTSIGYVGSLYSGIFPPSLNTAGTRPSIGYHWPFPTSHYTVGAGPTMGYHWPVSYAPYITGAGTYFRPAPYTVGAGTNFWHAPYMAGAGTYFRPAPYTSEAGPFAFGPFLTAIVGTSTAMPVLTSPFTAEAGPSTRRSFPTFFTAGAGHSTFGGFNDALSYSGYVRPHSTYTDEAGPSTRRPFLTAPRTAGDATYFGAFPTYTAGVGHSTFGGFNDARSYSGYFMPHSTYTDEAGPSTRRPFSTAGDATYFGTFPTFTAGVGHSTFGGFNDARSYSGYIMPHSTYTDEAGPSTRRPFSTAGDATYFGRFPTFTAGVGHSTFGGFNDARSYSGYVMPHSMYTDVAGPSTRRPFSTAGDATYFGTFPTFTAGVGHSTFGGFNDARSYSGYIMPHSTYTDEAGPSTRRPFSTAGDATYFGTFPTFTAGVGHSTFVGFNDARSYSGYVMPQSMYTDEAGPSTRRPYSGYVRPHSTYTAEAGPSIRRPISTAPRTVGAATYFGPFPSYTAGVNAHSYSVNVMPHSTSYGAGSTGGLDGLSSGYSRPLCTLPYTSGYIGVGMLGGVHDAGTSSGSHFVGPTVGLIASATAAQHFEDDGPNEDVPAGNVLAGGVYDAGTSSRYVGPTVSLIAAAIAAQHSEDVASKEDVHAGNVHAGSMEDINEDEGPTEDVPAGNVHAGSMEDINEDEGPKEDVTTGNVRAGSMEDID